MSLRTVIEINNDYAFRLDRGGLEFMDALHSALLSGSDEAWDRLARYGVTRLVEHHHSDEREILVNGRPAPLTARRTG